MANLKSISFSAASTMLILFGYAMLMPALADNKLPIMYDDKSVAANNDVEGLEKTIEQNFSPEDRARLRKALDDYAKNTDPEHYQIEIKRKAMKERVEERFLECDKDSDETIDRQEATACLPQVARHFNFVDIDEDELITLEELELAQAKSDERQKQAEIKLETQRIQTIEAELKNKKLLKTNKQALNGRKRPS
jgi:Ca2+-binding EF-hand superfamily protein